MRHHKAMSALMEGRFDQDCLIRLHALTIAKARCKYDYILVLNGNRLSLGSPT